MSRLQVTSATGKVTLADATGVGITTGGDAHALTFLFDHARAHAVARLSFEVAGTTERLVVTTTNVSGPIPATTPLPGR